MLEAPPTRFFSLTFAGLPSSVQHARLILILAFYLKSCDEKILNECFDAVFNPSSQASETPSGLHSAVKDLDQQNAEPPASQRGKCVMNE